MYEYNTVLVGKPEGRNILENNIMMNPGGIRWDGTDWTHLA
jgi:hypothetical protein